ncbi:MAG: glycosyltransferase family 2 protein [Clostridiaceae bacterium]
MKKLIIIPAYNEEKNIVRVIANIKEHLPEYDYVIVNDGSKDDTLKICKENNFNVIDLPVNLGIGGAVQTGYKYAFLNGYDFAIQIDGDGQHNSEEVEKLLEYLIKSNSNLVIGSRFIKNQGFQSTFLRRVGINYFSRLIKLLTGKTVTDPTSGFRMCDKEVIELFAKSYPTDYPEPESIVTVIKKGLNVNEIDVLMNEREGGVSSIGGVKAVYYMIKVTLAIIVSGFKANSFR